MRVPLSIALVATFVALIFVAVQFDKSSTIQPRTIDSAHFDRVSPVQSGTASPRTLIDWSCNGHIAFGLPGNEDQLLCRDGYAVGYDYERKVPSWVAYHLTEESVAKRYKRSNKFTVDKDLPENYRAVLADYKGSGYDRGHMAPAATVDFSKESMQESFLLSNMAPQLPGLNRQGWKHLESAVRNWTEERGALYVVTGALFEGEVATIGDRVSVPTGFYKVIFDPAQNDGIAFLVPQRAITKADLPGFIVTIDLVEARTGLDFISALPDDIENSIENRVALMW